MERVNPYTVYALYLMQNQFYWIVGLYDKYITMGIVESNVRVSF